MRISRTLLVAIFLSNAAFASGADIDGDGFVTHADLEIIRANFYTDHAPADIDGNGRVDYHDLALFRAAFARGLMRPPNPVAGTIGGGELPTVTFQPETQEVDVGDTVAVDIEVDFTVHPVIGGSLDIFYDETLLQFESFNFGPDYTGDPDFSRPPDELPGGTLNSLAIGNFFDGIVGPETIGTLNFTATAQGVVEISGASNEDFAGPFISFDDGSVVDVNYSTATVVIGEGVVVMPLSHDFGTILGLPAELDVTVSNFNPYAVTIEGIGVDDPLEMPFTVAADGCTGQVLATDGVCSVTILFDSLISDSFEESFDIVSDDPVGPSTLVTLTGASIQPAAVDILPGECPSTLFIDQVGFVKVAILGSADFNVASIDGASIRLNDAPPIRSFDHDVATPYLPLVGREDPEDCTDLGPDGFSDLLLLFEASRLRQSLSTTESGDVLTLTLTGAHVAAYPIVNEGQWEFAGEDVVVIERGQ